MSRWSTREAQTTDRGQVEPTATLVALFAVVLGVSLYAGVIDASLPGADEDHSEPTLRRVHDAVTSAGIVAPRNLEPGLDAGPDGYRVAIAVRADGRQWRAGPTPPADADDAARRVSVRTGPARIVPGTLRVTVWR